MEPMAGSIIFDALLDKNAILLAVNPRITKGIATGVFKAAKDTDSALLFELARSECNQHTGYTGLTPKKLARNLLEANEDIGHDVWALHADHVQVKKGDPDEIKDVKELLDEQIEAGYTSFALDPSYLFDFNAETVKGQLQKNLDVTIELTNYIKSKMGNKPFGLEVEVGEVGKKNEEGMVLTTVEEALTFVEALKEENIHPNALAVSNGSTHGNIYDSQGNPVQQVTIDIKRTKEIANALREKGYKTRIAQHGITGTPLDLIQEYFPKGDIIKGNVATHFQNIAWDVFKIYESELYKDALEWVLGKYKEEAEKKGMLKDEQIFGSYSKYALKEFSERIYAMEEETERVISYHAYSAALMYFKAFNAYGSAQKVREYLKYSYQFKG